MFRHVRPLIFSACFLMCQPVFTLAQEADNGTDPTRIRSQFQITFEHMDLGRGVARHTAKLMYDQPVADRTGLRLTLPLARYQGLAGDNDFDMGDIGIKMTHIPVVTRSHGIVLQGEVLTDTAGRDELGNGSTTIKLSGIYARFLQGGAILAPSVSHTETLDNGRISETVLDFYFVPKLPDPTLFVTLDPALVANWQQNRAYGSLAVTVGKSVGQLWGGNTQAYLKPTVMVGNERAADWAIEAGIKVIGF